MSLDEIGRILETVYGDSPTLFPVMTKLESKNRTSDKAMVKQSEKKDLVNKASQAKADLIWNCTDG